ncbi:MAG: hypothetical protein Q8J61_07900, partial [Sulfuricella sp.]|nr:hypothetical protein [Sulfuricella sp.]
MAQNKHVGWVERFFAKPNKPKLQEQVLLFMFVGFRDKAAQPNLLDCISHQFESHPDSGLLTQDCNDRGKIAVLLFGKSPLC